MRQCHTSQDCSFLWACCYSGGLRKKGEVTGQLPSWGACRGHLTLDEPVPSLRQCLMTSSAGFGITRGCGSYWAALHPAGWLSLVGEELCEALGSWKGLGRGGLSLFLEWSWHLIQVQAIDLGTVWSCHKGLSLQLWREKGLQTTA